MFLWKPSHLQNDERGGGAKKKKKEAWKARYSTVLCTGSLDWHLSGLASYLKLANTSVIQQSEKKEHQE